MDPQTRVTVVREETVVQVVGVPQGRLVATVTYALSSVLRNSAIVSNQSRTQVLGNLLNMLQTEARVELVALAVRVAKVDPVRATRRHHSLGTGNQRDRRAHADQMVSQALTESSEN